MFNLHRDLPFLAERMKIERCKKFVCNIHNKENYVVHVRTLKYHKVIQCNQEAWLKPYINMNIGLRTKAKNDFEKRFLFFLN